MIKSSSRAGIRHGFPPWSDNVSIGNGQWPSLLSLSKCSPLPQDWPPGSCNHNWPVYNHSHLLHILCNKNNYKNNYKSNYNNNNNNNNQDNRDNWGSPPIQIKSLPQHQASSPFLANPQRQYHRVFQLSSQCECERNLILWLLICLWNSNINFHPLQWKTNRFQLGSTFAFAGTALKRSFSVTWLLVEIWRQWTDLGRR